ncbi:MAG: carbonate dehydratase [Pseudomonadota bacterium]
MTSIKTSAARRDLRAILHRNRTWADERVAEDPGYFARLADLQTPDILWIGCSDSRVPANTITGLEPGEVFVHRNVANVVFAADLNCMSVIQYAVEALQVHHIVVCGHYGCGGVRAALQGPQEGVIDHWLDPIRGIAGANALELDGLASQETRVNRLCELNVMAQVENVAASPIVRRAWASGQQVSIHGWIYGLSDGLLNDLNCTQTGS